MRIGTWFIQSPIKKSGVKFHHEDWSKTDLPQAPFNPEYGLEHGALTLKQVHDLYDMKDFNTDVVLQSHIHKNPTTAKACGMPVNWHQFPQFGRWGITVLRVHVDICRLGLTFESIPHVEPDPMWDPAAHLRMVENQDEVRGPSALLVLKSLLS